MRLAATRSSTMILLGLMILTIIGTTSCQEVVNSKTLKLAHGLPSRHPVHQAMEYMGEQLDSLSDGKLRVELYPSEQLGSEREILELLQLGAVAMTKVSAAVMENFSPKLKLFSLPYLFRSKTHQFNVLDGEIGQELLDGGEKYFLKGIGYFDAGSRSFYAHEPIMSPDALNKKKIRVMESQMAINLVNGLGGKATPISWGELYTALQQGTVDGAENNPPSFYQSKHYEVCKHYSLDEHTRVPDLLVISTHVWESLSPQEQTWLDLAVERAVNYQRLLWEKAEQEALEAVQAEGVKVYRPEKSSFETKIQPIYKEFMEDESFRKLILAIKEVPDSTQIPNL